MSRHNYTQYSNNKKQHDMVQPEVVEETVTPEVKMEPETVTLPETAPIVETVNTVTLPKTVKGAVANCAKLNIREEPRANAAVLTILNVATEIEINPEESDHEWLSICTATGVKGYCMRKFVDARL